jgi:hypothetical protein
MTAPYTPMRPLRPRANNAMPSTDDQNPTSGQPGMRPPTTFAGMQQRGIARPAPPQGSSYYQNQPQPAQPAAPAPGVTQRPNIAPSYAPSYATSYATYAPPPDPNRAALTGAVGQLLAQPSAYQSSDLQRDYGTLNNQLALDSASGKRAIDETMAARGLHASTLTGDAYGNLEKQQGVTRQQFANNYLDREASDLATARANAISAALGVQSENADEGLATFGANQAAQKQAHDEGMDVANLGLQTELGRGNLGVSQQQANTASAAQASTAANQAGTLQLGRDTLSANTGNAALDRAQALTLQSNQLTAQQRTADLDRTLQQTLGLGNLDLQNRQLDSSNTNAAADREQAAKLAADQLGLDYSKLSEDDKQYLGNLDLGNRQLTASNTNAANQLAFSHEQLASTNANNAADREQAAKIAADSLGLNYAQLSEQQKESLADMALRQSSLDSSNTNAAADRKQAGQIADMQDYRAGQSIGASSQNANTAAFLQALTLASQLGFGDDKQKMQDFIDTILGKKTIGGNNQGLGGTITPPDLTNPYGI